MTLGYLSLGKVRLPQALEICRWNLFHSQYRCHFPLNRGLCIFPWLGSSHLHGYHLCGELRGLQLARGSSWHHNVGRSVQRSGPNVLLVKRRLAQGHQRHWRSFHLHWHTLNRLHHTIALPHGMHWHLHLHRHLHGLLRLEHVGPPWKFWSEAAATFRVPRLFDAPATCEIGHFLTSELTVIHWRNLNIRLYGVKPVLGLVGELYSLLLILWIQSLRKWQAAWGVELLWHQRTVQRWRKCDTKLFAHCVLTLWSSDASSC